VITIFVYCATAYASVPDQKEDTAERSRRNLPSEGRFLSFALHRAFAANGPRASAAYPHDRSEVSIGCSHYV